ncbi:MULTISPECIES: HAD hydrolase-like protein [unclassified Streptococcus]|uniref:HAD hydrolase-like protein n=1 Tax=unclassified Streptococcus TaxID=2608887 RepID=UPI001071DBB8|nr:MULTISPECIES: HAD hydrolase-like protein [unclassified Streptococcus]MBF0805508.1 HAD hydrolase-like protein [Streptococcus sp. 19428wA2_WM07]TFU29041.1 HAD family hydrolase [Streptococcus sp. WM07]
MFLFFDLDGTLVDSGPGIRAAFQYAFTKLNLTVPNDSELDTLIGPPLERSFALYLPEDKVEEAIRLFRNYYKEKGVYQADPYPGIKEALQTLKEQGHYLAITTSKNQPMAQVMVQHFEFQPYFQEVFGALPDSHDKIDVLKRGLEVAKAPKEQSFIIGDTRFDMAAGRDLQIGCVGVEWGYGTSDSLTENGAQVLLAKTHDLTSFLK